MSEMMCTRELECNECNSIYRGETSRQIKVRTNEHIDWFWKKAIKGESPLADYPIEIGHGFQKGREKFFNSESFYSRRLALEYIEIVRYGCKENINLLILVYYRKLNNRHHVRLKHCSHQLISYPYYSVTHFFQFVSRYL